MAMVPSTVEKLVLCSPAKIIAPTGEKIEFHDLFPSKPTDTGAAKAGKE
jgi:hypothetical protein